MFFFFLTECNLCCIVSVGSLGLDLGHRAGTRFNDGTSCLLAIGTADQSLMMVGSGMVSSGGIDRAKLSRELT